MGRATPPKRRALMQRVRQSGTSAEMSVAAACRDLGITYRLNVKTLPGSPDLANKSRRWAIFVNGCFWHAHPGCRKATVPKQNRQFWVEKFAANRARDEVKIRALRDLGYCVLIVWECEIADVVRLRRQLSNLREPRIVDAP